MAKKQGGTFFGNLIAKVSSKVTGGLLGGNRSALLQSGNGALINATAPSLSANTYIQDDVSRHITLPEVVITDSPIMPRKVIQDNIKEFTTTSDGGNLLAMDQKIVLDDSVKIPIFIGLGLLAYSLFGNKR